MLTCQQITELATDHLEGRLSWTQRIAFLLHLSMCRHCRAYLQQLKATLLALRTPASEQPSAAEEADLLERFKRSKP